VLGIVGAVAFAGELVVHAVLVSLRFGIHPDERKIE